MKKKAFYILFVSFAGLFFFACEKKTTEKIPTQKKDIKSVLILGNSITFHQYAPSIGWQGNWGMAASAPDSDYVHLLTKEMQQKDSTVKVTASNMAYVESIYTVFDYARLDSFPTLPDMIIFRFGENVDDNGAANGILTDRFDKIFHRLDSADRAVKVIVSSFWARPNTNKVMKEYAEKRHYIYVHNDDLLADSSNSAYGLFEMDGVSEHPSDKGMRKIKERIWEQIKDYF